MNYDARLTIAVPVELMPQANQLALLIGQSASDAETFTRPGHLINGVHHSVASTACVPKVVEYLSTGLPTDEDGGVINHNDADLTLAGEAFMAIQQGLIKVSIKLDATAAMLELGAVAIAVADEAV